MKVVCAWCKQEIRTVADAGSLENHEITHGICQNCQEYFFEDEEKTLDKFLNRLEAPVLMVDEEGLVVLANDQALAMLGKPLAAVKGFKGGDVMECAYARLPEGCGHTVHCAACTIRVNVMETMATGQSLRHVPAYLNRLDNHRVHKIKFLISTEKLGNVVLLRIDEAAEV